MLNIGGDTMALQDTLRALADPIRREILNLLKTGRRSAGEITSHFEVTGASISRHLSVLKEADLIRCNREGKYLFYELNTSVLEDIMLWISDLKGDTNNDQDPQNSNNSNIDHHPAADSDRSDSVEPTA